MTEQPAVGAPPPDACADSSTGDAIPAILGPVAADDPLSPRRRRAEVQQRLLAWYAREGRSNLPWRHTRDPYAVLVAEVMLQQTQVERVMPKYAAFLARFPSLAALAAAPVADVITAWAGLGYNSRAVRLREIAVQAVARFGGVLPANLGDLLALKGIGRYTAGAVLCFGFGQPVAMVDTNVRRVLWRVFRGIEPAEWPADETSVRMVQALADWALPPDRAYDWGQALMDLGATVCLARRPACERCPLRAVCAAYHETARVTLFPSGEALVRLREERAAAASIATTPPAIPRRVAEASAAYATEVPAARRRPKSQPFTSTTRYFRGRIVDVLRGLPSGASLPVAELGACVKPGYAASDEPWLRTLLARLERDGLVRLVRVLPGPLAATDAADGAETQDRVALP